MRQKLKRTAAAVFAAVMLFGQCQTAILAEESFGQSEVAAQELASSPETEITTEAQTQAATEVQTQAPTESQTEAQTQAVTEAQTQAPTESQTEAQTQAVTEAQTQAPTESQTEAQTQAVTEAQTETQTQAVTEAQTETPTESQTEAQTEGQTETQQASEKEQKEETKQTEEKKKRSDRRNEGEKVDDTILEEELSAVLPYLFAAKEIEIPEGAVADALVAQGDAGASLVSGLADFSRRMADARSSSMVRVINVYADQDGKLDEKQLKKAFSDKTVDVTEQYVLVNVIAYDRDQTICFSDYPMKNGGREVRYQDSTQPGDILYNFAALDGNDFIDFEGTVKLSSGDGLQGAFLAPCASVEIQSGLAGAVYANRITVAEEATDLMRIILICGAQPDTVVTPDIQPQDQTDATEPESQTQPDTQMQGQTDATEPESQTQPDTQIQGQTDATEPESQMQPDTGTQSQIDAIEPESQTQLDTQIQGQTDAIEPESQTQPDTGTQSQTDATEPESQTQPDTGTQSQTDVIEPESQTQPDAETESPVEVPEELILEVETEEAQTEAETMSVTGTETEPETDDEGLTIVLEDEQRLDTASFLWYSEPGVPMQIRLTDGMAELPEALSGGEAVIRAADPIIEGGGQEIYSKDAQVGDVLTWTAAGQSAQALLHYGGNYYLEVTKAPTAPDGTAYPVPSRVYFCVDAQGQILADEVSGWYTWDGSLLSIPLYQKAQALVSLTEENADGTKTAVAGTAAFVIKDAEGKLLRDASGYPKYYIQYAGQPVSISGLTEGTYFLSQVKAPDGYQMAADMAISILAQAAEPVSVELICHKSEGTGQQLGVSLQATYNQTVLTAEQPLETWIALFSDPERKNKVSDVKKLSLVANKAITGEVTFDGLADGTYYIGETDEYGESLAAATSYKLQVTGQTDTKTVLSGAAKPPTDPGQTESTAVSRTQVVLERAYSQYPTNRFSYQAEVQVAFHVLDDRGNEKKITGSLYAMLFGDEAGTKKLTSKPLEVQLSNASSASSKVTMKLKTASASCWIAQTDKDGKILSSGEGDFVYTITYPTHTDRKVTITCGKAVSVTVQNQMNATVLKIRVVDGADGSHLSGAKLALKNPSTGKVISVNNANTFTSRTKDIEWKRFPAGTYMLTEITAPAGYNNTPDQSFTVVAGKTNEVVLTNTKTRTTGYSLTAVKQVYAEGVPVYARDVSGAFAAKGCYTFYAALFSDEARTQKVSDVQRITVSALSGETVFRNLTPNQTYYLAETNEYGNVQASTDARKILYSEGGVVTMNASARQAVIQNSYTALPEGYRHTATLTITKKLQNASGAAEAASKTFYAGIFRTADYSDKPTVVPLQLENNSEVSTKRRVLLPGSENLIYYIAEVDETGKRITDATADFGYTVTIDQPQLTLTKGSDLNVTITNKVKVTKVTLYVTKRVYEGSSQKEVNATFYAGLFKDPEFKQLFTKPIPLELKGKSEQTLKLTLNLGSASGVTIYVAEVDKNGKLIKSGKDFGYDVRVMNAMAAFTQERTEIQSILLNSVVGSTDGTDWDRIIHEEENNDIFYHGGGSGDGSISWNGSSGGELGGDVQTGDETPIRPYVIALVVSAIVAAALILLSRRKKK